jgi:DNA-binding transcriptional LysR family regulator
MAAETQVQPNWLDLQIFADFATDGDIAASSGRLRIDETTVSRRIRRLEEALALALVELRQRKLILTEAGRMLALAAQPMADAAMHVSRIADQQAPGPKGLVRLTAIRAILGRIVLPGLGDFRARYPDIEIEMIGDTRNFSLARREADLAIRLALPTGNELVTRKLADMAFAVYGAAGADGSMLPWLGYGESFGHLPEAQWLERNRAGQPVVLRTNGIEMLVMAVRSGLGRTILPCFAADHEPGLVRLSPQPVLQREVWLAVHDDDRRIARVRAVMDLVIERFEAMRPLLAGEGRAPSIS